MTSVGWLCCSARTNLPYQVCLYWCVCVCWLVLCVCSECVYNLLAVELSTRGIVGSCRSMYIWQRWQIFALGQLQQEEVAWHAQECILYFILPYLHFFILFFFLPFKPFLLSLCTVLTSYPHFLPCAPPPPYFITPAPPNSSSPPSPSLYSSPPPPSISVFLTPPPSLYSSPPLPSLYFLHPHTLLIGSAIFTLSLLHPPSFSLPLLHHPS